jgi:hypothetical protein
MGGGILIRGIDRRIGVAALIAIAGVTLTACGGEAPAPTPGELWCDGLCTAVQGCGYQTSQCQAECVTQRPGLASYSVNGVTAEQACLGRLSCPAISGDDIAWHSELDACWEEGKRDVVVTPRVREFCAGHALARFDCGYWPSRDSCEHIYGMWSDVILDRVASCDAKPSCDEAAACQEAVFNNL